MHMLLLNFIIPAAMFVCVWMLKKEYRPYPGLAPYMTKWKINLNGYDTPRSRTSKVHWDFAQKAAPKHFLKWAWYALLAAVVMSVLGGLLQSGNPNAVQYSNYVSLGLGFLCISTAFRNTEKELKKQFEE